MKTKKFNGKKLTLNKETVINLENVKAGKVVAIDPIEQSNGHVISRCDTCLCAPTFWEGCQLAAVGVNAQQHESFAGLCAPTFWDGCN